MTNPPLFNVGGRQVDRREVNPELIARMARHAPGIDVEANVGAGEWKALSDRVAKGDQVSEEDLKTLQDLGKACWSHHRKLHSEFRDGGYKDKKLKTQLQDVHVFLDGSDRLRDQLKLADARAAVQALAGASFGPMGLVTAYAAFANLKQGALEPLVEELQSIQDGKSRTVFPDNQVQAFHGDAIWKQMNQMLDGAIQTARDGKPVEVNAQYYELTSAELVGKLAQAAEAGNKVRVNVDAGRLVAYKGDHVEIDEVPHKLRSILQLTQAKGDIAVSAYPVPKKLEEPGDLMHRKGLRVGDTFLLSGMNANEGSGENIDAGYLIEGPAARQLVKNFSRDVNDSLRARNADVYGEKPLADFMEGDINMGSRGLIALWDCMAGPAPAGTPLRGASNLAELKKVAQDYGHRVSEFVSCTAEEAERLLADGEQLPLNENGKKAVLDLIDRALGATRTKENVARLEDISLPKGEAKGSTAVALADLPTEREALMITAIQEAEQFIYVPAFVMTRAVSQMLVARRDEMKAQGKDLDIRVLADPGVYPDGGTPNEIGVKIFEDAGVPVRWALLPRSGWHDRKIHAKQLLTDKGEFYGSTNFSNKGLRENWEQSGYVRFDEKDPASVAARESAKAHFLNMWERESFDLNSKEIGYKKRARSKDEPDYHVQADEARFGVVRDTIKGIEKYEEATGALIEREAADPKTAARVAELRAEGYDEGSAILRAVQEKIGEEAFYAGLERLPERRQLENLR